MQSSRFPVQTVLMNSVQCNINRARRFCRMGLAILLVVVFATAALGYQGAGVQAQNNQDPTQPRGILVEVQEGLLILWGRRGADDEPMGRLEIRTDAMTTVRVDQRPASLADLQKDMWLVITPAEGVAERIMAFTPEEERDRQQEQSPQQPAAPHAGVEIRAAAPPDPGLVIRPRKGDSREIHPALVGYNGNLTSLDAPWEHQQLVEGVRRLHAGNFRYPGGTIGNYWDWDIGWIDQDIEDDRLIQWMRGMRTGTNRYTIENLAKGQRAVGFTPVFMLNMITDDLENQLAALRGARDAGIPVELVELGNEYYFGPGAEPYVYEQFPTPEEYAHTANEWAEAIRSEFPGVRIAAVGSDVTEPTQHPRRQEWNERVVPLLRDIDAITVHLYTSSGLNVEVAGENTGVGETGAWASRRMQEAQYEALKSPEQIARLIVEPHRKWRAMLEMSSIPEDIELWVTEFNMWDRTGPVRHTWAHGLHVASFMTTLLDDRRVNLVCFHNAYGGGDFFPALLPGGGVFSGLKVEAVQDLDVEPFARSAGGWVMSIFGMAMNDMTQLTRLHFPDAPEIVAPELEASAVSGWIFADGQTERVLLVNFTEHPLCLATGELAREGVTFRQFSQEPNIHIVREEMMDQRRGRLGEELTLPPFSLTVVNPAREGEQMPTNESTGH